MLKFALALSLFIFSVFPTFTYSDVSDRGHWLQKELKLSSDQRVSIKGILKKYSDRIQKLKTAMDESRVDLRKSFRTHHNGRVSDKELLMKFENYRSLRTQWQRERFLMALEIRKKLSNEQLTILNNLNQEVEVKK